MENKEDRDNSGVDDTVERIGEMVLASISTIYAIVAGVFGLLPPNWSCIVLIVSFGLYQGTSVLKYISDIKNL